VEDLLRRRHACQRGRAPRDSRPETKEPDYGFEHWIDLPNGTERWLSSNSAPVLSEDEEVEYVVVGFEDTTRLKEREDKLTSDKRRVLELYSKQLFSPLLDVVDGDMRIDVDEVVRLKTGRSSSTSPGGHFGKRVDRRVRPGVRC